MKITIWQWICGVRYRQLSIRDLIELRDSGLISNEAAKALLVKMGIGA